MKEYHVVSNYVKFMSQCCTCTLCLFLTPEEGTRAFGETSHV